VLYAVGALVRVRVCSAQSRQGLERMQRMPAHALSMLHSPRKVLKSCVLLSCPSQQEACSRCPGQAHTTQLCTALQSPQRVAALAAPQTGPRCHPCPCASSRSKRRQEMQRPTMPSSHLQRRACRTVSSSRSSLCCRLVCPLPAAAATPLVLPLQQRVTLRGPSISSRVQPVMLSLCL
jgi:hypothetical protein